MAMEITQVVPGQRPTQSRPELRAAEVLQATRAAQQRLQERTEKLTQDDIREFLRELQSVSTALNKRLSFRYHEELDQVVVKVIDRDTDKVIKELPPSEIQRVHLRIREALGLLFDETV